MKPTGSVPRVPSTLSRLGTNNIDTNIQSFGDVFWVSDHVHHGNAGFVQVVDDVLGRYAHGADKKRSLLRDDDIDEFVEVALCVVVLAENEQGACVFSMKWLTLVLRALPPTWGRRRSTPKGNPGDFRSFLTAAILGIKHVNINRPVSAITIGGTYLLTKDFGRVTVSCDHSHSQLWRG